LNWCTIFPLNHIHSTMKTIDANGHRLTTPIVTLLLALFTSLAHSDITITARETGGNVVFSYSGSLVTDSYATQLFSWAPEVDPDEAQLYFADLTSNAFDQVIGDPVGSDPGNFGTGTGFSNGVLSGDSFVIRPDILAYPAGYISGSPLSGSLTIAGQTFASLGIDPSGAPYQWVVSGGDTISLVFPTTPTPSVVSTNDVLRTSLQNKIRELKKKAKKAKKAGRIALSKKLKKKIKKLSKKLRSL